MDSSSAILKYCGIDTSELRCTKAVITLSVDDVPKVELHLDGHPTTTEPVIQMFELKPL